MKKTVASLIGMMILVSLLFSGCVEKVPASEESPTQISGTPRSTWIIGSATVEPSEEIAKERATSFSILDANGGETNYPIKLYLGEPALVIARIENNEHEMMNYVLQVKLNDDLLESKNIRLDDGSQWEQKISFTSDQIGTALNLEFLLFKDRVGEEPYKAFHLVVSCVIKPAEVVSTPPAEILTLFSILDANGTKEYHPSKLHLGEPEELLVRIENNEQKEINYFLQMKLDGKVIRTESKWLTHGSKWEQKISFTPDRVGDNQALEFLLFKDRVSEKPYQYFNRSFSAEINYKNLEPLLRYEVEPLSVVRDGEMTGFAAWTFAHVGNLRASPYAQENTSSPYSYGMKQYGALNKGDYSELSQGIYSANEGVVVLSFNVRDSFEETSEDAKNIKKQVLLNDEVVWADDVSGRDTGYIGWIEEEFVGPYWIWNEYIKSHEGFLEFENTKYEKLDWWDKEWITRKVPRVQSGWTHVDVPVYLFKGNNKLRLQVYAKEATDDLKLEVYWDDVELKPVHELVKVEEKVRMKPYGTLVNVK